MTTQLQSNIGTYRDFITKEIKPDINDLLKYFKCKSWSELCESESRVNQVIDLYLGIKLITAMNDIEVPF